MEDRQEEISLYAGMVVKLMHIKTQEELLSALKAKFPEGTGSDVISLEKIASLTMYLTPTFSQQYGFTLQNTTNLGIITDTQ